MKSAQKCHQIAGKEQSSRTSAAVWRMALADFGYIVLQDSSSRAGLSSHTKAARPRQAFSFARRLHSYFPAPPAVESSKLRAGNFDCIKSTQSNQTKLASSPLAPSSSILSIKVPLLASSLVPAVLASELLAPLYASCLYRSRDSSDASVSLPAARHR